MFCLRYLCCLICALLQNIEEEHHRPSQTWRQHAGNQCSLPCWWHLPDTCDPHFAAGVLAHKDSAVDFFVGVLVQHRAVVLGISAPWALAFAPSPASSLECNVEGCEILCPARTGPLSGQTGRANLLSEQARDLFSVQTVWWTLHMFPYRLGQATF